MKPDMTDQKAFSDAVGEWLDTYAPVSNFLQHKPDTLDNEPTADYSGKLRMWPVARSAIDPDFRVAGRNDASIRHRGSGFRDPAARNCSRTTTRVNFSGRSAGCPRAIGRECFYVSNASVCTH